MAIVNFICEDCKKNFTCKWVSLIMKFDIEKKEPVGVNIKVESCDEFDQK